jgi:hypothetical protein
MGACVGARLKRAAELFGEQVMFRFYLGVCIAVAVAAPAVAKPIAFADGTTVMAEYGAGTMREIQIFYAPRFDYSVGGGHVDFTSDEDGKTEHITYARLNWLAHRWNLDSVQANIFMWGGLGSASGNSFYGPSFTGNAGVQADYETRRVYASLKTDLQKSSEFSNRVDTLQLGLAPYKHDYGDIATWFLFQARHYTDNLHAGIETAALLRLFKGGAWIEAGVTNGGKLQAMAMFNF